ncbi:MAG: TrkA C-terminal domain-containing protein [Collinsella sp.]
MRDGTHPVLPNGDIVIEEGDLLVMAAPTFEERAEVTLREVTVTPHGRLAGQRLRDVPQGKHPFIVVMLKRDGQTIIPDGNTPYTPVTKPSSPRWHRSGQGNRPELATFEHQSPRLGLVADN